MVTKSAYAPIFDLPKHKLTALFEAEPDRLGYLTFDAAGIHFDLSKTHLDRPMIAAFLALAGACDFDGHRKALFAGDIVNPTEGRPAEHPAERGVGKPESVERAKGYQARMRALIDAIEGSALGPIRHVLQVGIGGSALGPNLLVDALGRDADRYDVAVVSNVDGAALDEVFKKFDPTATLLAVASKTFTTTETMMNAESVVAWMQENGVEDPYGRVIALTAAPDKAMEWGVDETRILPFAESVGGRYSLWSSIGFGAAIGIGWDAYEELLEGAAEMDRHFMLTAPEQNIPLIAAFADRYYAVVRGSETRAVFAYDERLRLLPSYLQQLEMESNGKRVTIAGEALDIPSSPITWGGVGTDAQHAVFQLLHQGTHVLPVEFIASIEPGHGLDDGHHHALLASCFAQGAALMAGKGNEDPARAYPGDRPSTTLLVEQVDPRTLGALIAFYEHRTFCNAVLTGINPFDQFGVELGKQMAKAISTEGTGNFDASTQDLIARAFG
ncbi:glucose-6-phosphate isomerase [Sphingomonas sp. AP4-R1]|uniref:glucose-6-phosphate isomerase n=1 Tax=Sphingomonas sp. AP4-R1 TaxID=2735134 RepID=UPI0014934A7E|nr:glucose-6-phosphate isomerase [Sphingomonas sp. AP4-R1]QJU59460.1 glucose-6-phosphate isomerase [Sphingomonas sp. AP4-R1]